MKKLITLVLLLATCCTAFAQDKNDKKGEGQQKSDYCNNPLQYKA